MSKTAAKQKARYPGTFLATSANWVSRGFNYFYPRQEEKPSLNDVTGNSCSQTLKGSLPASSKSSSMVLTEADPGIILISMWRELCSRLKDLGRGACQELLAGMAQAPGSCPSVGVRRRLTWSDPLLCVLPEVTAVHGAQLSRSDAKAEH